MYVMLKARKLDWRESLIVECKKTTKSLKKTLNFFTPSIFTIPPYNVNWTST